MNITVARTCSELDSDGDRDNILSEPKPLSAFRQAQTYVLLGDAGSGKTTEFQQESETLGDSAVYLSARQFNRSDVGSRPEWRGKTLFIDGLDEMRAGTTDRMIPLDLIITQLDRLGQPSFRLSCREADWLGTNDRQNLADASTDSRIRVLRLDPLDDDGIRALLTSLDLPGDVGEFVDQARRRGLGAILHNPQTLTLLADAVQQGGIWPASRQETFELACKKMASEWNEEHLERADHTSSDVTMDAVGYLCALQLLAGTEGYSMSRQPDSVLFPSVEELQAPPNQLSNGNLRQALTTRLFTGVVERRVSPIHRHIAEFLAGRHLAKLIESGLPVERVMALMTSPSDQRVVTVLRGLSAWLAAHSPSARRRLIDLDPVGVGLYGDIKGLPLDDKRQILESLAAFAEQGPLFGHERPGGGWGWHRRATAQAFRSLASADMADAIREVLTKPGSEPHDHRIIEFVLEVLTEADEPETDSPGELTADIENVLVDPSRPADLKVAALDAYLHLGPPAETRTQILMRLLEETHNGVHHDPLDELRGSLLALLYPDHLAPQRIWQYLASPKEAAYLGGRFWIFHQQTLLETSSVQQVGELLDALDENSFDQLHSSGDSTLGDSPFRVLARGLEKLGDDIELARLFSWLSIPSRLLRSRPRSRETLEYIRTWLQARPEIQKDLYLAWLRKQSSDGDDDHWMYWICNPLQMTNPPNDLGLWCLDMAVELEHSEPPISLVLLNQAYLSLQQQSGSHGLTLEVMKKQLVGHNTLANRLDELCTPPPSSDELNTFEREIQDRMAEYEQEKRQRQSEWADLLRSREDELRENRLPPQFLGTLAKAYFAIFAEVDRDASPLSRIREFVGGDSSLANAVIAALRDAVWRDDLPEADETTSLFLESKHSFLAFPVLASLELLHGQEPRIVDECDDSRKRKALAVHYCIPKPLGHTAASPIHDRWLLQDPDLVLDVLYQCAVAALRSGETYIPGLTDLDNMVRNDLHPDLAHGLRLRLLKAFPARAPSTQHEVLDRLLGTTLRYPNRAELEALATKKLASTSMTVAQRVRWLTVGTIAAPNQFLEPLREFIGDSENRTKCLAEFFRNSTDEGCFDTSVWGSPPNPAVLRHLIKLLGRSYGPLSAIGLVTLEMGSSDRISNWIETLGSIGNDQADHALSDLIEDPQLVQWKEHLTRAWERQNVVLRDATYSHPSVEQVQRTLGNGLPTNEADLAALLNDHLNGIAEDIRGSNSNIWRQFWNEDKNRQPAEPKLEDSCRDALLSLLQERSPSKIDAAPEGRYVSDKRADIRVSYGGFNVPIEIKKDCHRNLWCAVQDQLIKQYTTDPASSGHGIYLVLWTGGDEIRPRPDGKRPATPDELRELLEGDLTPDEASKIPVIVLDITKP